MATPTIFFVNIKGCFLESQKKVGGPIFYFLGNNSDCLT